MEIIGSLGGLIAGRAIEYLSETVQSKLRGEPQQRAITAAYAAAVAAFASALPEAQPYEEVVQAFLDDELVTKEFARLLEPSRAGMPKLEVLRQRFDELGFDLTTMPGFALDAAIAAFSDAFLRQAANDPVLRDILDSQKINTIDENVVALLKGQDQLLARLELPMKAYRRSSLSRSAKRANAAQKEQENPVHYIGLSVAEQFALQYLRIFELPPSERKSLTLTTSEVVVVLPVEELETIFSWLPKLAQAFSEEGPQQRRALQSFLAAEIAPAVMEATQLRQRGQTRPLSPLAEELSRVGIRYLVLGLTPPIAELVEILRDAVNAGKAPKVERASIEVYFASYEDFQSAFSHLQQFLAQVQQAAIA